MKKIAICMLALLLMVGLVACGGGNGGSGGEAVSLSGTFVVEGGTPGTLNFTADSFVIAMPFSEMDLDMPGDFNVRGTFVIDEDAGVIRLTVDRDALEADALQLVHDMLAQDPMMSELMEDPEFAEELESAIEEMANNLFASLYADFDDITLEFEDSFDRLVGEDGVVFVRQ